MFSNIREPLGEDYFLYMRFLVYADHVWLLGDSYIQMGYIGTLLGVNLEVLVGTNNEVVE